MVISKTIHRIRCKVKTFDRVFQKATVRNMRPEIKPVGAKPTAVITYSELLVRDPLDGLHRFDGCPATLVDRAVVNVALVSHEG